MPNIKRMRHGFTLIELMVVIGLAAVIMAVVVPNLVPMIAFGDLEGSARHLAGFGRGAMAHCTLMRERFTIRLDLDNDEYWAVRWPAETDLGFSKDEDGEKDAGGDEPMSLFGASDNRSGEELMAQQAELMQERVERFARAATMSRAKRVQGQSILDGIDPLFEKEFRLEDEEKDFEEVKDALLERTRLPEGVHLESVQISGQDHVKGIAEIEIWPTGLEEPVSFVLSSDAGDYYTVKWDAITGGAYATTGKEGAP
ncbi:MAG: type II secretion system protein [Candidatus Hydrogenedentes bacterium]|nr:type II secretion system protein [Candidatus Hydrogenedentota bacterium]